MPIGDLTIVTERLAILERKLLGGDGASNGGSPKMHVSITKNYGIAVGASLAHGHQQIVYSDVAPRRVLDHLQFEQVRGQPFSAYLLEDLQQSLVVKDYGPALMLVPPFMRRPYDMMLVIKDVGKQFMHELTSAELAAIAEGWHDAARAFCSIFNGMGKPMAYNVAVNTGPGASCYLEFLPYTQVLGALEQIGLYICQELPETAADRLRQILAYTETERN